jgi:hypothetical protein
MFFSILYTIESIYIQNFLNYEIVITHWYSIWYSGFTMRNMCVIFYYGSEIPQDLELWTFYIFLFAASNKCSYNTLSLKISIYCKFIFV